MLWVPEVDWVDTEPLPVVPVPIVLPLPDVPLPVVPVPIVVPLPVVLLPVVPPVVDPVLPVPVEPVVPLPVVPEEPVVPDPVVEVDPFVELPELVVCACALKAATASTIAPITTTFFIRLAFFNELLMTPPTNTYGSKRSLKTSAINEDTGRFTEIVLPVFQSYTKPS